MYFRGSVSHPVGVRCLETERPPPPHPAPFGGAELNLEGTHQDHSAPPNGEGNLVSRSINISLLRSQTLLSQPFASLSLRHLRFFIDVDVTLIAHEQVRSSCRIERSAGRVHRYSQGRQKRAHLTPGSGAAPHFGFVRNQ